MDIQNILEMIKLVGAAAGAILSIIALITALSKKPKQWLINTVKEANKEEFNEIRKKLSETNETQICVLRHEITDLYYLYKDKGQIPTHAKLDWIALYEKYTSKGGNSYIKMITEKMMNDWEEISGD